MGRGFWLSNMEKKGLLFVLKQGGEQTKKE